MSERDGVQTWQILLGVEAVALMIAAVMPVTPNKLGSDRRLAEVILDNPGYIEQVAFYLLFNNVVFLGIAAVGFVWWRWERGKSVE